MNISIKTTLTSALVEQEIWFPSSDQRLNGRLYLPKEAPQRVVIINGATGVPASYYGPFARWLAQDQNVAVLIYDYRDFGASATRHMRHSSATMTDWGVHDQEAARAFAVARFPDLPLWIVGHSLGAMCLPFQRNLHEIDRVIAVASGAVHVGDHPWPYQGVARFFWYGIPLAVKLAGYVPGKALRMGSDLPASVYWQWRRWCTNKAFLACDFGTRLPYPDWKGLTAAMKFVAIDDDDLVPAAAVWRLMQFYPEAYKSQLTLRPADHGLSAIGHISAFAERNRACWPQIMAD